MGGSKDFSCIITDVVPDVQLQFNGQCFPLYYYEDTQTDTPDLFSQPLSAEERYLRRDGLTDFILTEARRQYGPGVTKEDLFYYIYGVLHSPDYRMAFATDLKKSLPRLPLVASRADFLAFSQAGRELAELHLHYETVGPCRQCIVKYNAYTNRGDAIDYRIEKMRFGKRDSKTADKTVIHYNSGITIEEIPLRAYDYVVNGKSAVEWLMERYAVQTDPRSGITNDPNRWAAEHGQPKYILDLLLSVVNLSLKTLDIVDSLPRLLSYEKTAQ